MKSTRTLVLVGLVSSLLAACSSSSDEPASTPQPPADDAGTNDDGPAPGPDGSGIDGAAGGGGEDSTSCEPGENPLASANEGPVALIVTSEAMRAAFEPLAQFHAVTGVASALVTTEELCAGACVDSDPKQDTAKAIKTYIVQHPNVSYVVLGGDIEVVPSRKVHDTYSNPFDPSYTFDEDFYTDFYYSDLSEWDTNGDGVYAQDGVDTPQYGAGVSVSRVSVKTEQEAEQYFQKVLRYSTRYDGSRARTALLVSNIATEFNGIAVDGAWYFEANNQTVSQVPEGFALEKLYATKLPDPTGTAKLNSPAALESALGQGYNLIAHNGHGGTNTLMVDYTGGNDVSGDWAYALQNSTLPILMSCACDAGRFASGQGSGKDSAGEQLVKAPNGGAIAYLGNTATGLGIAGGSQFIDEAWKYIKGTSGTPLLADAFLAAHESMPDQGTFQVPIVGVLVNVIDRNSYEWTKKSVVVLGDALIPVWRDALPWGPTMTATQRPVCEGTELSFQFGGTVTGTLRVLVNGHLYRLQVTGASSAKLTVQDTGLSAATAGWTSDSTQLGFTELKL